MADGAKNELMVPLRSAANYFSLDLCEAERIFYVLYSKQTPGHIVARHCTASAWRNTMLL